MKKKIHFWSKKTTLLLTFILICSTGFANIEALRQARTVQHKGKYDDVITVFNSYLLQPVDKRDLDKQQQSTYTKAFMQLMNTFKSKANQERAR